MNKIEILERELENVRRVDLQGNPIHSNAMYRAHQARNSFGLARNVKIHRIFQKEFYESDRANGVLTLPRATASVWGDPLENPLEDVMDVDLITGGNLSLGGLVRSYYALCWTQRPKAKPSDWASFSHGRKAIRISTTVGKLLDRLMDQSDPCYMHRTWLVEVEYEDPNVISAMRNPAEVYSRMDSSGGLLALSAAVVRAQFYDEEETRLLLDNSDGFPWPNGVVKSNPDLLQIPFDWGGFVDREELAP